MATKCPTCGSSDQVRKVKAIIAEQSGLTASKKRKMFKREYSTLLAQELAKKQSTSLPDGSGYIGCGGLYFIGSLLVLLINPGVLGENPAGYLIVTLASLAFLIIGIVMYKNASKLNADLAIGNMLLNERATQASYCSKCGIRFDEDGELD